MTALAAQTEGEKDYSIFDDDKSTTLFCDSYLGNNHPFCKRDFSNNNYVAYEWSNSGGLPVVWKVLRSTPTATCSCSSDIILQIRRISLQMCRDIVEMVKNNFTEKEILGFGGYGTSHFNKSIEDIYKLTCTGNGTYTDTTTLLSILFKIPPKEELGDTCACSYPSCKDICRFDDFR